MSDAAFVPTFSPRRPAIRAAGLLALPVLFALAACGGGRGEAPEAGENAHAAAAQSASAVGSAAAASAAPLPPAVEALGHHAENAYDQVRSSNWPAARTAVDSLKAGLGGLDALPAAEPFTDMIGATVAALDTAVTRRDRARALVDANALTRMEADVARVFHPAVPADVTLLDYYGRELEIWSTAGKLPTLQATATRLRETWDGLRPQVVARNGAAEATRFDALLAQVAAARAPADYARLATPVLDEVDALEKVFTR